jgi:hypothetical protein
MGRFNLVDDQINQAFGAEPIPLAPASGAAAPRRRGVSPVQPGPPMPEPQRQHPLTRVLLVLIVLAAAMVAGIAGWEIRRALWQRVEALRDERHLMDGFDRGLAVVREAKRVTSGDALSPGPVRWLDLRRGYRAYYDEIRVSNDEEASRLHDPPLRVAILAAWVNWLRERDPVASVYVGAYARSLLVIGMAIEGVTALLAMMVVVTIARRGGRWRPAVREGGARAFGATLNEDTRGATVWVVGLAAAVLLWLNPAILLNGHLAPAFDVWVVPLVLLVVLLVAWEAWLSAGAVMLLACLMQGQAIYVAPLLFLWPMFQGRFAAGVRALTGFAAMAALLASPWLVPSQRAWAWVGVMVAFAAVLAPWLYPRRLGFAWWVATAFTLCVLIGSVAFDSSWPAVRMLEYVAQTRPAEMIRGPASNLPALLAMRYDWSPSDVIGVISIRPLSFFRSKACCTCCWGWWCWRARSGRPFMRGGMIRNCLRRLSRRGSPSSHCCRACTSAG